MLRLRVFLGLMLAASVVGGASAADPLPDRRAVRPSAAAAPAAPAAPAGSSSNEALVDLASQLDTLQAQMRELRGQIELQRHDIEQLKNREHQSTVDFDKRLRDLEHRGTAAADGGGNGPVTVVTPPIGGGPNGAPARAPTAAEQQQYDAAFGLMKQGLYERAAKSFRDFVARNPDSPLADNAQYWIGEAAYVTRDFRTALDEFNKVVAKYPQSEKVPDALLKIGYIQYELAAYPKARDTLKQVVDRYPNTAVAKSASLRLEKMAKEGR